MKAEVELGGPGLDVAEVWAEHAQRLRRIIWLEIRDHNQVDDVLQETFVRVCRAAKAFDANRGELAPWLNTMARRACLDLKKRWHTEVVSGHAAGHEPATTRNPEDELFAHERSRVIARAFNTLNGRHRRLLQAHISGLPYDEIAAQERLSADAVKSVMARARSHFRASYTEMAEKSGLLGAAVALRGWLCRARARLDQVGAMANEHFASVMGASVAAGMLAVAAAPLHTAAPVVSAPTAATAARLVTGTPGPREPRTTTAALPTSGTTVRQPGATKTVHPAADSTTVRLSGERPGVAAQRGIPDGSRTQRVYGLVDIGCDGRGVVTPTVCPALAVLPALP